jgi:type VI secretion system secreted protein VgrG
MAAPTKPVIRLHLTSAFGADKLRVEKFTGTERISGLFRYDLGMVSSESSLDFSLIVGKNVTVTMDYGTGQMRYFNGIVGRFVQSGTDGRYTTYYAEVYPWLWLCTMTQDCRIFQNKTVPDIITELLNELGFTDITNKLTGTYTAREYCVQYRESAFDFVSRLMEEEGIYYFFAHEAAKHSLVLADDSSANLACPGLASVKMKRAGGSVMEEDVLLQCTLEQRVTAGKYAMEDFNFETPSTDLLVSAEGTGTLRVYEYPAAYSVTADGEKIANKRLQAHELPAKLLRGESCCRAFIAGSKFDVKDHLRTDINSTYVLAELNVYATQDSYSNSFTAYLFSVPYRPKMITKKPVIVGTQTAIVVGQSGEEIFTDKYGRVKVQFHWDQLGKKDENSSCWVRVTQGLAGKAWGSIFIPRMGQEVIVSFINGDPDRPLVTGMVYNAEQTVPYTLPDKKTQSTIKTRSSKKGDTKTFNEIRFEDLKGSEEIYIHAEKNMNIVVENNRTVKVGDDDTAKDGSETIEIKNNRTTTIKEGDEVLTVEQGNREVDVQSGTETHSVAGTRDLSVSGEETHTNDDSFTQEVAKDYTLKVDGNLLIDVKGTVTIKSGKDLLVESAAKVTIKSKTVMLSQSATTLTNKSGTDLTIDAGTNMNNKAGVKIESKSLTITNDASAQLTNKSGGMGEVSAGGILTVKGAMVQIN